MHMPIDLSNVVIHFSTPLATSTTTTASVFSGSIFIGPATPNDGIHPPHAIEMIPAPGTPIEDVGVDMAPNAVVYVQRPSASSLAQLLPPVHPVLAADAIVVLLAIWGVLTGASTIAWVNVRQWLRAIAPPTD